ncbi:unnamed protein product [Eretmochelys imbricata]
MPCPSASPPRPPATAPLPAPPLFLLPGPAPSICHPSLYLSILLSWCTPISILSCCPRLSLHPISPPPSCPCGWLWTLASPAMQPPILPPAVNQPLDPPGEEQRASWGKKGPAGRCPGPACGQLDGCGWPWWRGQAWQRGPSSPYCRRIHTSWHRGTTTPRQPGGLRGQQDQGKWEPEGVRAAAAGPPLSSRLWGRESRPPPPRTPCSCPGVSVPVSRCRPPR